MNLVFGNYGDNTIALIQWLHENHHADLKVIHVDTGWAAPSWLLRIKQGQQFAIACGFEPITLTATPDFASLVRERRQFPSQKYQWCAGFLKGLTFLKWAEQNDPNQQALIILGSRRDDSRMRSQMPEFILESEHFGDRKIWYPLYQHNDEMRDALISRAGFEILHHRSLECHPCIHSSKPDFQCMDQKSILRLSQLENEINQKMFQHLEEVDSYIHHFDMGCGSHFACGE